MKRQRGDKLSQGVFHERTQVVSVKRRGRSQLNHIPELRVPDP